MRTDTEDFYIISYDISQLCFVPFNVVLPLGLLVAFLEIRPV